MHERLIELLQTVENMRAMRQGIGECADYLLANGVIVLPAMLGTTVYCLAQPCGGCECYNEPMREEFIARCRECDRWEIIQCNFDYELIPEYGKTVFLTREEAEVALEESDNK